MKATALPLVMYFILTYVAYVDISFILYRDKIVYSQIRTGNDVIFDVIAKRMASCPQLNNIIFQSYRIQVLENRIYATSIFLKNMCIFYCILKVYEYSRALE